MLGKLAAVEAIVLLQFLQSGGESLLDTRVRLGHLRRDPRVSLTVIDEASWYTHVSLVGRVTELYADEDLADIDRLSIHYGGNPYPNRESPRTTAWMEIDRWHGWGATDCTMAR